MSKTNSIQTARRSSVKRSAPARPRRKTGQRAQPARKSTAVSPKLVHDICAVSDPFCPGANSAKWPDNSFMRSLNWNIPGQIVALNNNATGQDCVMFLPTYGNTVYPTSIVGTNVTFATTVTSITTAPTYASVRLTNWGLQVYCVANAFNSQGTVHIRTFAPMSGVGLATVDYTSTQASTVVDIPISRLMQEDCLIIPMPMGSIARNFRPSTEWLNNGDSLSGFKNPGWEIVTVGVAGAAANSVTVAVKAFYHYEYLPLDGDSSYSFATPPPASSPLVQQGSAAALKTIGNVVTGTYKKLEEHFTRRAANYLAGAIGGLIAGPAGATALALTVD